MVSTYQTRAEELHKILFEEDNKDERERKVKDVITNNDIQERLNLRAYYESMYAPNKLKDDLDSQLSSNFKDLVIELFMDPLELDCFEIHEALHALTYDKENIYEIITARPYKYKRNLISKYEELYEKDLMTEIKDKFGADKADNIISLLITQRNRNSNPDVDTIVSKTSQLIGGEEIDWTKNKYTFNDVFAKCSPEELVQIGRLFYDKTGKDFLEYIQSPLLKEVMYNTIAPSEGFARKLHEALKRFVTNKDTVTRIIASRNDVDLGDIKKTYNNLYHITLAAEIAEETSGVYKDLLVDLVSRANPTKQD